MNREQLKSEIERRKNLILSEIQSISIYALALQSPVEPSKNLDKEIEAMKWEYHEAD